MTCNYLDDPGLLRGAERGLISMRWRRGDIRIRIVELRHLTRHETFVPVEGPTVEIDRLLQNGDDISA